MLSDEQRALWSAIRANLEDDTPRLAYADWLQAQGQEDRAELIRVQCEQERLPLDLRVGRTRRPVLRAREVELLAAHRGDWPGDLRRVLKIDSDPELVAWWNEYVNFHRGFINYLFLEFPLALRLVRSGIEPEPMTELAIRNSERRPSDAVVREVVNWELGRLVNSFQVKGARRSDVDSFLGGRLDNLSYLGFTSGPINDEAIAALAGSPLLAPVRQLQLGRNQIGDAGAAALADSPHLSADVEVVLYDNPLTRAGARRLRERFGARLSVNVHLREDRS
jgi:uncharacterized protein (TIGR02996 family)